MPIFEGYGDFNSHWTVKYTSPRNHQDKHFEQDS